MKSIWFIPGLWCWWWFTGGPDDGAWAPLVIAYIWAIYVVWSCGRKVIVDGRLDR